jgi:CheY-like chemotaxis protein
MTEGNFVLVVDDDDDIREAIVALLEDAGHRVVGAANGRQALEILQKHGPPCVILLDLMMPVMNGAEFRTRQLADPQIADVPVVVITAAGRQELGTVPADATLTKPIRAENLFTAVERYCRSGS